MNVAMLKQVLRKIFLEDWLTKLVALAITIALWVGVTGLSTPTTRRIADVPLTLSYSNKTEITNSPQQTVSIVVSGDKRRINQLTETGLVVSLDLTEIQPGDRVIQLTPESVAIDLPLGVKLQEIQPNRIAVRLESVEEKEVPVVIETQGEPANGFEFYGDPAAFPARVRVRGPASYIRNLTFVQTEKVDIGGRQAEYTARQVPLNIANPKASVLEGVVDVHFRIGERRVERSFTVPLDGPAGKRASVVLFGGASLFEGLTAEDLTVSLADGADKPTVVLPPSLEGKVQVRKVKLV